MIEVPEFVVRALLKVANPERLRFIAQTEGANLGPLMFALHEVDESAVAWLCTEDGMMIDGDLFAAAVEAIDQWLN